MKVLFKPSKQIRPEEDRGFKVNYAPAKRAGFRVRWYLLLFFVISPLVIFLWYGFHRQVLVIADGVLTTEPITIYAPQDGLVADVPVKPGSQVRKGAPLITFDSPEIHKEVDLLKDQYQKLIQKRQESIDQLNTLYDSQVQIAQSGVDNQKSLAQRIEAYEKRGLISMVDLVALEKYRVDALISLNQAKIDQERALQNLTQGSLENTLLEVSKQLALAEVRQALLAVPSPKDAHIDGLFVYAGEYLSKGTPLMMLSNRETPVVIAYLDPSKFGYTHIGQTATVSVPGGKSYEAVISEPTTLVQNIPGHLSGPFDDSKAAIKVTLTTDKPVKNFVEGLPVEIRFHY